MARILFRVDGNSKIGAGHIMRCTSIAIEAKKQGHECAFLSSDESYKKVVENHGIPMHSMNTAYDNMDREWDRSKTILQTFMPEIIVIDSYYVTEQYLREMGKYASVIYIDDVLSFPYPVDMIVNYNIYAMESDYASLYKDENMPRLLLGLEFAPLRKEFQEIAPIEIVEQAQKVLVTTGGADEERILIQLVNEVLGRDTELEYHLLVTKYEPDLARLHEIAKKNTKIILHENVKSVSELMCMCDMAISSAGSTLYELCACGLPTITYVIEDNQIQAARTMSDKGIMPSCGDIRVEHNIYSKLIVLAEKLSKEFPLRKEMQCKGRQLVDGKGVERLVKAMEKTIVHDFSSCI